MTYISPFSPLYFEGKKIFRKRDTRSVSCFSKRRRKMKLMLFIMGLLAWFGLAQCSGSPLAPTPAPTAPAPAPVPSPTFLPTPDPDRFVSTWRWSAKYSQSPWDPTSSSIPMTSYSIKEGLEPPSTSEWDCSPAIYRGIERWPIVPGTCRKGSVVRMRAMDVRFPVVWGLYTENP